MTAGGAAVDAETTIECLHPGEYEEAARRRLTSAVWDYIAGGSGDETTLQEERIAYQRYRLRPRTLVDVASIDTCTTVLGTEVQVPVGVAPMAYHCLAHASGETATVRAAGAVGALTVVSMFSSTTLEDIAAAAAGPLWMQLYVLRRREATESLVERAEAARYRAIVVTVDTPRMGRRHRDVRNGFHLPAHVHPVNLDESLVAALHATGGNESAVSLHAARHHDPTFTWDGLHWLRSLTELPIVLKGVLTAEDGRRAADAGVDGLIVSTHGGRQLDGAIAAPDALPEVADAVGDELEVFVDGGIRRGTDVLKALALGARAVFIGRPVLWGLAAAGAAGAERVLSTLRDEMEDAMALTGRPTVAAIGRDLLHTIASTP